ncbi:MAG: DUF7305 domain-containing protein, partial [Gemmatimonadota bacterium]
MTDTRIAWALATVGLMLCGCNDDGTVGVTPDGAMDASHPDGRSSGDSRVPEDGDVDGSSLDPDAGRDAYCMGSGPPVDVRDSEDTGVEETCSGRIAERLFRYAVCSCGALSLDSPFATDSFDSREGPYTDGESGGPVGANGRYEHVGEATIGGSLLVGGAGGMHVEAPHQIEGDLQSNGALTTTGDMTVRRDAWVRGDVTADGPLHVNRDLTQPPGATSTGDFTVDGTQNTDEFTVDQPCACSGDDVLDIHGLVETAETHNDNDEVGLDPDVLDMPADTEIEIPCGRFYLSAIRIDSPLTIRVTGRAAVFVDSVVDVSDDVTIETSEDAELDLFVSGSVHTHSPLSFGSADNPASVRVYVGGSRVTLDDEATFMGNLYAPNAAVRVVSAPLEVFGSVFAGFFDATADVAIHYDRGILRAGD